MTTADSETRIADLRARWEADPSSRVFVQLAEEYRRAGNASEAVEVLKKGLASQPNYVTAQAALGRCQLAAGNAEGAIEALSRVMEQDPSHPLAGKLLVEAHLQTGNLEEAKKRLEHYRMLADSGPEIEDLEGRLKRAQDEKNVGFPSSGTVLPAEPIPPSDRAALREAPEPGEEDKGQELADVIFDLGPVDLQPSDPSPFDLPTPSSLPETTKPPVPLESPFPLESPRTSSSMPLPTLFEGDSPDQPFGELFGAADLSRWSSDLAREGIFELGQPASGLQSEPTFDAEPEDEEQTKSDEATVTLGQLYLAQGHRREAARIFRSILERDPDNQISRQALTELEKTEAKKPQLPARGMSGSASEAAEPEPILEAVPVEVFSTLHAAHLDKPEEATSGEAEGITERKISALQGYLRRLRQAAGS